MGWKPWWASGRSRAGNGSQGIGSGRKIYNLGALVGFFLGDNGLETASVMKRYCFDNLDGLVGSPSILLSDFGDRFDERFETSVQKWPRRYHWYTFGLGFGHWACWSDSWRLIDFRAD